MRSLHTIFLAGTVLLAGCSSLPTCGTPEAQGQTCTTGWAGLLADFNASQPPPRNYITNPITLPTSQQTVQPNFGNTGGEQYQTIMVNTPNGYVYKRCKVLKGQVVACF